MNDAMLAMFNLGPAEILLILVLLGVMAAGVAGVVLLVVWLVARQGRSGPAMAPVPPTNPAAPPTPRSCPRCGAPLPADAPEGLCPRCVLGVGLATPTDVPDQSGPHGTRVLEPPPKPAEIAKHFPQLEIFECLGHGGMGVVYKARQPKLNRLVALKVLEPEKGADPRFAERFQREAQALACLSHPNIVTVHDFGEADGLYYLLMEYVDGVTLRQLLQTRKLVPEEALKIVPKICEALQFAHDQGIVHRDIKPENVLLDKQGRVKIADFGIAKLLGGGMSEPALTEEQSVLGTPHYMAPEQVEKPQLVDHRADIYSLGVVFYEMLTGELPLGKFQPPSKKVQVDVRLDEVVLHALEKEPERRYQQAGQIKTDVETIATTQPSGSQAGDAQSRKADLEVGKGGHGIQPGAAVQAGPQTPASIAQASGDWATVERARRLVKWPALGLIISSLLSPFVLGVAVASGHLEPGAWMLFPLILELALVVVSALGGFKLLRLESRPMALAGSIAGCILSFFNFFCLPFAVWALAASSRREVRGAFAVGSLRAPGV